MAGAQSGRRQDQIRHLILDSGAIIALARRDPRARAFLARVLELRVHVEVPAVVLAETVRGGARDAPINHLLKTVGSLTETREVHARTAGRLLGSARSAETIDALVVAHAVAAGGALILTGDQEDLERLAAPHPEVRIRRV